MFYGDIEKYKQKMLETQKEATGTATALKKSTDENLTEYSGRTNKVIETNEKLIGQIHDHLRKVIGATLFTAFDKRRGHLFWGTILWGILLGIGTIGAAAYGVWFAHELVSKSLEPTLIFTRIIIAAPIAFWITFAARQYGRERRAEEEYAFKAAISVSLEPYRELVVRMRANGEAADAEFVKTLITDIFDNPTKRLYPPAAKQESTDNEK